LRKCIAGSQQNAETYDFLAQVMPPEFLTKTFPTDCMAIRSENAMNAFRRAIFAFLYANPAKTAAMIRATPVCLETIIGAC
jgi:hypothetical protein